MGRKVLGLDIGITSVGYGVIDIDDNEIIDYGVRLFKEGTASENEKRRTNRGGRRLKSRKVNRKNDLLKLLKENQIIDDSFVCLDHPYDLRIKGLHERLSNEELATALLHILKHRGSSLEMIEEDNEKNKDVGETKTILKENDQLIKDGYYVCEIQKKRWEETGKIRGNYNNFRTKDYVKEVEKILSNQNLNESLREEIITIIERRRHYSTGPGSFKSQTPYGMIYDEDGNILENMIDKMKGKCSLFPDEYRAPKMSYTAELFNLLNDLNNISIHEEKLSTNQKEEIISFVNKKGGITPKQLAKMMEVDLTEIKGFRINAKEEPILTEFKGYKILKKIMEENHQKDMLDNKALLDDMAEILTRSKSVEERIHDILTLDPNISENLAVMLSNVRGFSGYHAFSFKAMKEMIPELMTTNLNQMQIIHNSNLMKQAKKDLKGNKNIFADDTAILSPVAKRAQREAFKVVNRLRQLYGEFDSIVVEVTRDKNSAEQKKRLKETQKFYEQWNKEIADKFGDDAKINAKTKLKLKLYEEQQGKCLYSGESLDLRLILQDPTAYEVDHILPISVSFDDSMNNKVLVTHKANQEKGNLTPVMAFRKHQFSSNTYDQYKSMVVNLLKSKSITPKKAEYLLCEKDLTKFSEMKEFINRNLVDTSYACRVVMNTLTDYFSQNEIDTKVHTIRGKATSNFRKRIGFTKVREEDYSHHAIDALIVASLKKQPRINEMLYRYSLDNLYDDETGEIKIDDDQYYDTKYIAFLSQLKHLNVTKYSHKIDTKPNRQIADETIYSTRLIDGNEKVVKKYKNIYDPTFTKLADDIMNDEFQNKYLMAIHDPQSFVCIKEYVEHWYDTFKEDKKKVSVEKKKDKQKVIFKVNPLCDYKQEFGCFRKYSKKGNGAEIIQMKYLEDTLGNHINITKNYQTNNKNVVLLQVSPYRTDFYKTKEGKYKFVTVRYKDVKYIASRDCYMISKEWYDLEKKKKGISDEDSFVASFHRDELIGIVKKAGKKKCYFDANRDEADLHDGTTVEILKFTATNNDKKNIIEVKPIYKYESKQLMQTIGSDIINIKKYATDVTGNLYEVKNSKLKLEF